MIYISIGCTGFICNTLLYSILLQVLQVYLKKKTFKKNITHKIKHKSQII